MKALTILYHDIIEKDDDESGFPGPAAARYKLKRADFAEHLAAISNRCDTPSVAASVESVQRGPRPFLITVDDGGIGSLLLAADVERLGFSATFFITTDRIGTPGFMTADDLRSLRRRGHAVGSHSHTHPYRMSDLPDQRLEQEWQKSVELLTELLGEPVETASVPGGYYSPRVAAAARSAGIRVLFNSEPTTQVATIGDCLLVGRFNVYRGMTARAAGDLAAGRWIALQRQQLMWQTKKAVKTAAQPVWEAARAIAFRK